MKVIGITGSSGAGKSTVCNIFKKNYKVKIIDADLIARELSKAGTKYIKEIVQKFGQNIIDENGELKRKKLAEIIYADSQKRETLNNCTFQYIIEEVKEQIAQDVQENTIIIDAPLLFESKLNILCDVVIGVISDKELQVKRIIERDNIDYNHAINRLDAQEKNDFFIRKCDEIIENHCNIKYIEKCVHKIAKKHNITKKLQ